ncbi:hypothetical protein KEM60_00960 [Austwickia sp. TVS 96-490-7B]|uniref:DUF4229 domain-containing protein n=1 Tax=Austwickia sp. TVS 96-490-7B TaxID=2830843 RepID=UPI001C57D530|nr:DUF4229 domain-containing protein [Austwickia sp. TVS 96-490-7B]MBW3084771.1 hypothetical protein [Austwickia sp. TVS 96-490-7B]
MSAIVRYSLWRLLAFAACLLILWLIPFMRDNLLLWVLAATTAAMLFSLFFLNGPREELSAQIASRIEHRADQDDTAAAEGDQKGPARQRDEDAEEVEIAADGQRYR